jgi:hypothetical protein
MFVIDTKQTSRAAWKTSILMVFALLAAGSFISVLFGRVWGLAWLILIFTLHTYVRPKPSADGFRLFGFRLGR